MKKTANKTTEPITMAQIDTLMTSLGITEQDIDNIDKEQEEEDSRAMEKWDSFVTAIMALPFPNTENNCDKNGIQVGNKWVVNG